jgi:hypothetical protein
MAVARRAVAKAKSACCEAGSASGAALGSSGVSAAFAIVTGTDGGKVT